MADLIDRQAVVDMLQRLAYDDWNQGVCTTWANAYSECADMVEDLPSADAVDVVRCKDCKHQEKYFYADGRMKGGGRFIYGCDLADGYSHICLDDDFCSRGERKDGNGNG